jgi:cytochrome c553
MRKPLYLGLVLLVAGSMVLLMVGQSQAIDSKKCFNCHTMHNSQNGSGMLLEYRDSDPILDVVDGDPQGALIRYTSCAGCHISTSGTVIVSDTPIVFNTGGYPDPALAGGNFYYASTADINKAHNCTGVTVTTDIAPPGFMSGYTDPSKQRPVAFGGTGDWGPDEWTAGTQVTCAGEYGCHGNRTVGTTEFGGIRGSHHGTANILTSNQVCTGATVPTSYRFLAGIKGTEQNNGIDDSYERNVASDKHNAYYGRDSADRSDPSITSTISFLCAECHGNFHDSTGVGTASPWLRHPTDIDMPLTVAGGGASEFAGYTTYDPVVPVGFITTASANVSQTTVPVPGIVMCVSCHRAHGSTYNDLLRWAYAPDDFGGTLEDQPDPATAPSCRTCHRNK